MSYSSFQYQLSESLNKQKEGFQKLDELIADIHQRYLKIAKVSEQKILQNYQNQMQEAKTQFDKLRTERHEDAIRSQISQEKIVLEKECAASIKKSLQISKVYESLKIKWANLQSAQHQMELQKKFLQSQIKKASKIQSSLETQNQQIEKLLQEKLIVKAKRKSTLLCPFPTKSDIMSTKYLTSKNINQRGDLLNDSTSLSKKIEALQRIKQLKGSTQARIKQRIEAKKAYTESFVVHKSTLEEIFSQYDLDSYKTDREKSQLIQKIFSDPLTKKELYRLLFEPEVSGLNNKENINQN